MIEPLALIFHKACILGLIHRIISKAVYQQAPTVPYLRNNIRLSYRPPTQLTARFLYSPSGEERSLSLQYFDVLREKCAEQFIKVT